MDNKQNSKQLALNRARQIQSNRKQVLTRLNQINQVNQINIYANMHESDRQTVNRLISRYGIKL